MPKKDFNDRIHPRRATPIKQPYTDSWLGYWPLLEQPCEVPSLKEPSHREYFVAICKSEP